MVGMLLQWRVNLAGQEGLTEHLRAALKSAQNKLPKGGFLTTWGGPDGSKLKCFSVDWTKHEGAPPQQSCD
eukprot:1081885-Pelagomonas_calceolata.AAC.2